MAISLPRLACAGEGGRLALFATYAPMTYIRYPTAVHSLLRESDLYLGKADGTEVRKLVTTPGKSPGSAAWHLMASVAFSMRIQ